VWKIRGGMQLILPITLRERLGGEMKPHPQWGLYQSTGILGKEGVNAV